MHFSLFRMADAIYEDGLVYIYQLKNNNKHQSGRSILINVYYKTEVFRTYLSFSVPESQSRQSS